MYADTKCMIIIYLCINVFRELYKNKEIKFKIRYLIIILDPYRFLYIYTC